MQPWYGRLEGSSLLWSDTSLCDSVGRDYAIDSKRFCAHSWGFEYDDRSMSPSSVLQITGIKAIGKEI